MPVGRKKLMQPVKQPACAAAAERRAHDVDDDGATHGHGATSIGLTAQINRELRRAYLHHRRLGDAHEALRLIELRR